MWIHTDLSSDHVYSCAVVQTS